MSSFKILHSVGNMSLRCPPELLLRQAIRQDQNRMHQVAGGLCTQAAASDGRTYRAAVCTELGKPLTIQHLPRKVLAEKEVRLRTRSVGINFSDILIVQGLYQEKPNLPFTPGSELAGEVLEVGSGVKNVKVGQRVFGMSMMGAFAEETVLESSKLVPLPKEVDFPAAAALLCSYGTAYLALKHRCNIKPGETVLVTAAAGGVGLATVDLATKMFGAKVIGACGGAEKCALVKQRGAVEAIDYNTESVKDRVKELTNGKGANVIIDAVGGDIFDQCMRCVAFEGRIAVVGFASGTIPKIPANLLLVKSCSAVGVFWGSYSYRYPEMFQESVVEVTKAMASGVISPHVSKTFPLDQVNEAFLFVAKRKSTGKAVVSM